MKNATLKWLLRAAVASSGLFFLLLLCFHLEVVQSAIARKAANIIEEKHGLALDFKSLHLNIWDQKLSLENCSVKLLSEDQPLLNIETIELGSWRWKQGNWQLGTVHLTGAKLDVGELLLWDTSRRKPATPKTSENINATLDLLLIEDFVFEIASDSISLNGILDRLEVNNLGFMADNQHAELIDFNGVIAGKSLGNDSLEISKVFGVWNSDPHQWSLRSIFLQSNLLHLQGEANGTWETEDAPALSAKLNLIQGDELYALLEDNYSQLLSSKKWSDWTHNQLKKNQAQGDINLAWKKNEGWETTFKDWTGLPGIERIDSVSVGQTKEGIWTTSGTMNGNNFSSLVALKELPIQNANKYWLDSLKQITSRDDRWDLRWNGNENNVNAYYNLNLLNHPFPVEGKIAYEQIKKTNRVEWNASNIPAIIGDKYGYGGAWQTSGNLDWTTDSINADAEISLSNGGLLFATMEAQKSPSDEGPTRWVSQGLFQSQENSLPLEITWSGSKSGDGWNWQCQGPLLGLQPSHRSEYHNWQLYAQTAIRASGKSASNLQFAFEMRNINLLDNGRPIAFNRMDILGDLSPKSMKLTWNSDITEGHVITENNTEKWRDWLQSWTPQNMTTRSLLPFFEADCSVRSFAPIASIADLPWTIGNNGTLHAHHDANGAGLEIQIPTFQQKNFHVSGIYMNVDHRNEYLSILAGCDSVYQEGTAWLQKTRLNISNDSLWRVSTSIHSPQLGNSATEWSAQMITPNHFDLQLTKLVLPQENQIIDVIPEPHAIDLKWGSSGMEVTCENLQFGLENWSFTTKGRYIPNGESFWMLDLVGESLPQFTQPTLSELSADQLHTSLEWRQRNGHSNYLAKIKSAAFQYKTIQLQNVDLTVMRDETSTQYNFDSAIQSKAQSKLSAQGQFSTKRNKSMQHKLNLSQIPLDYLNLWMPPKSVVWNGEISGELSLDGNRDQPNLTGWIAADSATIAVDYLGTAYTLKGQCGVLPDEFYLDQWEVKDAKGHVALINGTIMHDNFSDWNFDVGLEANDPFQLLELNREENDWFYGTAYATGDVNVFGFDNNLEIEAQLQTSPGTLFSLPLDGASDASYASFIHFQENRSETIENQRRRPDLSRFRMDLNIDVTEDAQTRIIFDESVGDEIMGVTSGDLSIRINDFEEMEMTGQLKVVEGTYFFTLQNLINKQFDIVPGGTISWFGDPYEAEIDLNTRYTVRTNLDGLLPDENNLPGRIPVQLNLAMQGALLRPEIGFNIKLPEAKPQLQSLLDGTLINEEEVNRQALSLLVLNQFLSPDPLNANFGGTIVQDKSTAFIASQLGHWISQISPDMDIGFDYNNDPANDNQSLAVALSTRLLDDRLHVEGALGTSQLSQVSAQNVQLQDMTIRYDLDKNGSFQLTGHTRQNPEWSSPYGETTQGVGFRFHREFNTWRHRKKEQTNPSQKEF